ncbi:MAG: DUF4363 family protein [Syntrophomonadaceae bacterium]
MRLLIGVLATLIILISSGIWINDWLSDSSDHLVEQIEAVSRQVEAGDWSAASAEVGQLERKWDKEAKWWPVFMEHQEIDNIEFSLARCKEYVSSQDHALAAGQLSEIRLMIEHIPRKEEINIENIF